MPRNDKKQHSSEKDFDNLFVMEKGGEIADLLSISPFVLALAARLKLLIDYTVTVIAEKPDLFIKEKWEERVGENS